MPVRLEKKCLRVCVTLCVEFLEHGSETIFLTFGTRLHLLPSLPFLGLLAFCFSVTTKCFCFS